MTDRSGQVWEHEDGEMLYVVERSSAETWSWWTTFSYKSGRCNNFVAHDLHFDEWESELHRGWVRLI